MEKYALIRYKYLAKTAKKSSQSPGSSAIRPTIMMLGELPLVVSVTTATHYSCSASCAYLDCVHGCTGPNEHSDDSIVPLRTRDVQRSGTHDLARHRDHQRSLMNMK